MQEGKVVHKHVLHAKGDDTKCECQQILLPAYGQLLSSIQLQRIRIREADVLKQPAGCLEALERVTSVKEWCGGVGTSSQLTWITEIMDS
jgi:hypothetical protein